MSLYTDPAILAASPQYTIPNTPVLLRLTKYDRPINLTALIDIGAALSILHPNRIPPEYWKPHTQQFRVANNEVFQTDLISKPIYVEFFPGLMIKHKFIGSDLPNKDLIISFDILAQLFKKKVYIKTKGLSYRSYFHP